jgi:hypothetical protein
MKEYSGEFSETDTKELSKLISGRIIQSVKIEYGYKDFLVFTFTTGSTLKIDYDWLYGWNVVDPL